MDTLRFHTTHRYVSQVPLRRLLFCVRVWRAPLVEEHREEVLCNVTVPWDGKVISPEEKVNVIRAFVVRETRRRGQSEWDDTHTSEAGNAEMRAVQNVLDGRQDVMLDAAAALRGLRSCLDKPESAFFTHPSTEDYFNEAEEDCPVDPPQPSSLLTAVVLRQHRVQHQQSNKMFFMWAVGGIVTPSADFSADMWWEGKEHVICTITAEQSELYFTAKPSINETHTLFVDSLHVYFCRITVSTSDGEISTLSAPADLIQQISMMTLQVKDHLVQPHSARKNALRRLVLQQVAAVEDKETMMDVTEEALAKPSFKCSPFSSKVRYHIFCTVERCLGVPEDALCLRCQWQHGVPKSVEQGEGADDEFWGKENIDSVTTQLAFASCVIVEDFIPLPVHTFNLTFEHHFNDKDASPLWLIVTVYSESRLGQQAPVGYTAISVPHTHPGSHSLRVPLWRPRQTGCEFLRSALVGGAPSLVDARAAVLRGGGGMFVRHGFQTEPSGEVEVSVMVMQQRDTDG